MSARLTKKEVRKLTGDYIACGGDGCPYCESTDVDGEGIESDCGIVTQKVSCYECGGQWEDEYKLEYVRLVKPLPNRKHITCLKKQK